MQQVQHRETYDRYNTEHYGAMQKNTNPVLVSQGKMSSGIDIHVET